MFPCLEVDSGDSGRRFRALLTMSTGGLLKLIDAKTFQYDDFHDSATQQISATYDLASGALLRTVTSDIDYGPTGLAMRERTEGTLIAEYEYSPNGLPTTVKDNHGNRLDIAYNS